MKKTKIVTYRRKREGRTNYKKRLLLLQSRTPRLIIRKTNKQILLQIAEYSPNGDKIICGTNSDALKKIGWNYACNNLPACYLAGLLLGKKALAKKVKAAILDAGLQTPVAGSRIYAALKGVIDAGMSIPASEEVFPSEERLSGKDIASFFDSNKNPAQFSGSRKKDVDIRKITQDFGTFKKKIISEKL
nr:large subunit ribosomal protein L18 [uncultured archaeon]